MNLSMVMPYSKTLSMKEIDRLNLIKMGNFCSAQEYAKKMRRQAANWKAILTKDIADKELLSKIYKSS